MLVSALLLENHVYELFNFLQGDRYDGSAEVVIDAGRQLALLHSYLCDFARQWKPLRNTFHDSIAVRRYLNSIMRGQNRSSSGLQTTVRKLNWHYKRSGAAVNELGFTSWSEQIVHSDWHPGNMLFSSQKVVGVFDFDSTKIAPAVTDIANGVLQFSIVAGKPNPADWPAYFDQAKLANFMAGYHEVITPQEDMLCALPDLMIETMIAEAVLPIATTGFFGHLSGTDFLKMIRRKCDWIDKNRGLLKEAVFH